jgi:hypothetical protein
MVSEGDLRRTKKLMESSVQLELHKSRGGMSRAKVECAKGVEHLKAYAR